MTCRAPYLCHLHPILPCNLPPQMKVTLKSAEPKYFSSQAAAAYFTFTFASKLDSPNPSANTCCTAFFVRQP